MKLYDTQSRQLKETANSKGDLSMYCCGPTVYRDAHVGNLRTFMLADLISRVAGLSGVKVTLIQNITDVGHMSEDFAEDDKVLSQASIEKISPFEIARKYEEKFHKDLSLLNIATAAAYPRASESIELMQSMITDLMHKGFAYVGGDKTVYFDSQKFAGYGDISGNKLDSLKPGHRYEYHNDGAKKFHADWALWKTAGERSEMIWDSPWGPGFPGWHIECSAMSMELLDRHVDVHVGGIDLRFPHHENERAQSVALGKTFAQHWMHNGFVVDLEGEKMSKSLGNVANLLDLLEHYDARAYRMLLLQTHYRSPVRVGQDNIDACVTALAGLDSFAARTSAHSAGTPDSEVVQNFRTAMDNDLDTTAAMALVFDSVRRANAAMDADDSATVSSVRAAVIEILGALGLELSIGDDIDADIVAKGVALDAARAAKDFAAADSIRNELQAAGYVVETTKDGTRVRRG